MLSTSIVVIDFETTGWSPYSGHRITEVAALRLQGNRVVDRFVTLVNAGVAIPQDIVNITGITDEMIAAAPPVSWVMRDLVNFIGSDVIVAHTASFDHAFLLSECARAGIPDRGFKTLCTVRLARRLLPGLVNYRLPRVAAHLGIVFPGRAHRAEVDAIVTAEILIRLVSEVAAQHSIAAVDPALLRRLTRWSTREVHSKLARALVPRSASKGRRPVREDRADPGLAAPTARWRLYPAGNLRDMQNDVLYRRSQIRYEHDPVPSLVVRDLGSGELRIPTRQVTGSRPEEIFGSSSTRGISGSRAAEGQSSMPGRRSRSEPLTELERYWASRAEPSSVRGDDERAASRDGATKPWMLDRRTGILTHSGTGRFFRFVEYRRVTGGYLISNRERSWVGDDEVEIV